MKTRFTKEYKEAIYEYGFVDKDGNPIKTAFPPVRGNEIKDGKIVPVEMLESVDDNAPDVPFKSPSANLQQSE